MSERERPVGLNTVTGEARRWTSRIGPAYAITKGCVACGACIRACPFDAIVQDLFTLTVVAEECPGCGKCVPVCPVDTIRPDPNWEGVLEAERTPVKNPWGT
jgi:MinD superfamily P-loop ATPase